MLVQIHFNLKPANWADDTVNTVETCASRPTKKCKTKSKLLPEMSLKAHRNKASRTTCELYDRAEVQKFRHLKSLLQEFKPRRQSWITFECLGKIMMGEEGRQV